MSGPRAPFFGFVAIAKVNVCAGLFGSLPVSVIAVAVLCFTATVCAFAVGALAEFVTVKLAGLRPTVDAVPLIVVTVIGPVVAPVGTVAVIVVSELLVIAAGVPLNAT